MKLVVVESPYAGDVEGNLAYVRACMADCLRRGEAPYASHALYTQPGVLDDLVPAERKLGIDAGFAWRACTEAIVFYVDRGVSPGMKAALDKALADNEQAYTPIFARTLGAPWSGAEPLEVEWG